MQQRHELLRRARKDADGVERFGNELEACAIDAAEARLAGHDATVRAGTDHRAAGLGAERERHHAVGDRSGGAARRAARRVPEVVRIARLRRVVIGELRGGRLAEDHAARAAQQRDAGCVPLRLVAAVDRRVVFGRHIRGVDHVLDADRYAVQRAARRLAVALAGFGKRALGVEIGPGMHFALALGDALEAGADQLFAFHHSAPITAAVTSRVRALPPRSGVKIFFAHTASTAFIRRAAAFSSPRCSSIIDAVQKVAIGLAMPLPVMSKAEPWIGSNIEGKRRSGLRLAVGAMPSEPDSAAARSERMSACKFEATITSIASGFSTMRVVAASTRMRSVFTPGKSFAVSWKTSSHSTMPWRCAFDLVTSVRCLRGRLLASWNANRCTRSTPERVKVEISIATSFGRPWCTRPPAPEYSPSVFSRTITQSRFLGFDKGLGTPGRMRAGRTLAYWSKPWQIGSRNPQSDR